jgi:hypothetical protein
MALRIGTEKFWITARVMVDNKKKAKHHQITGNRIKARSDSLLWPGWTLGRGVVNSKSLRSTSKAKMPAYKKAAAR